MQVGVCLVLLIGRYGFGQTTESLDQLLSQLESEDWLDRSDAVQSISSDLENIASPMILERLLDLMDRESQLIFQVYEESDGEEGVSTVYGEGFSEYYARLSAFLAEHVDFDRYRVLEVFAHGSYNPFSQWSRRLAGAGPRVLPIALSLANDSSELKREHAVGILSFMLEDDRLPEDMRSIAKRAIVAAASDTNLGVRFQVAIALGRIGTAEDLPLLQRIARTDEASYSDQEGTTRYPVRDAAERAIQEVQRRLQR